MSEFSSLLADTAEASLWVLHGDSGRVEYTPRNGRATSYAAIVGPEKAVQDAERTGQIIGYSRLVVVKQADLAEPRLNASVTVDDIEYVLRSYEASSGGDWRLSLFRSTVTEFSRPGYRRAQ